MCLWARSTSPRVSSSNMALLCFGGRRANRANCRPSAALWLIYNPTCPTMHREQLGAIRRTLCANSEQEPRRCCKSPGCSTDQTRHVSCTAIGKIRTFYQIFSNFYLWFIHLIEYWYLLIYWTTVYSAQTACHTIQWFKWQKNLI